VRDRDVAIEWLDGALEECSEAVRADLAGIKAGVVRERRVELKKLIAGHAEPRFRDLVEHAAPWAGGKEGGRLAVSRDLPQRAAKRTLGDMAYRVLRKRARRIAAFRSRVNERDSEVLHALRIESRRMRYAVEAWFDALGPGRKRLGRNLKAVQDALGDVHDADVRLEAWPELSEKPVLAWLHQRSANDRAAAWRRFQQSWPELLARLEKKPLQDVAAGG